ncbi:DUF4158 domain-containing protein [Streptomyces sp. NBC_00557]|uniref:DUF4158 domain-containing protein n=1 Tax=Streptomyces sp. NBC_00557 TaxID=2975776 RepID=UPI003FCE0922
MRDAYGYHPYDDAEWSRKFRSFLQGRAWTHAEGPVALFHQAVGWLRRNRVLLPGVSVLARQVLQVRTVAQKRLHAAVARAAARADRELPGQLVATLVRPEGSAVLGAGTSASAADADDGHGVRPCAGAGGRDRQADAGPAGPIGGRLHGSRRPRRGGRGGFPSAPGR